jgi:hypothetical protein
VLWSMLALDSTAATTAWCQPALPDIVLRS